MKRWIPNMGGFTLRKCFAQLFFILLWNFSHKTLIVIFFSCVVVCAVILLPFIQVSKQVKDWTLSQFSLGVLSSEKTLHANIFRSDLEFYSAGPTRLMLILFYGARLETKDLKKYEIIQVTDPWRKTTKRVTNLEFTNYEIMTRSSALQLQ